jgi:hypothetical protein
MKTNSNKHIKQTKTATLFQLQKGRKRVVKIPPIHNGIRKSLAMYNPKIIRNNNAVFCKKEEELGVII